MPKIIAQKEDWITLGYQLFSEKGISGIVIEKMAKKLSCNKSSFYWHFTSKAIFIDEIIKYWILTETEQIIDHTDNTISIQERVDTFLTIVFKNDPYLEFIFYLKRYATKNKKIQLIIDEIDERRLAYTSSLFKDLGYSNKEAQIKARIFYKYLIGHHEMIRYKKQHADYLTVVKEELKHFLNI